MSEKVPAGYAEILDTLNDALDIAEKIGDAVKDGFQVYDLATLLEIYPKAQEIYLDRHKFKAEFKDLDPVEAKAIYADLAKIRGVNLSWIEENALKSIDVISRAYKLYDDGREIVFDVRDMFKAKAA